MFERAVFAHIMASRHGAPLMVEAGAGLIVEVTDGDTDAYRGNLFYDLAKMSAIRLAGRWPRVAYNVTPWRDSGVLAPEAMLDYFGVTEANWQDAEERSPLHRSETPSTWGAVGAGGGSDVRRNPEAFTARGDGPGVRFTDIDGRRPDWGKYFEEQGR